MAVGAATGALDGSMADVGIDDEFISGSRARSRPGTSALFAMTETRSWTRSATGSASTSMTLVESNLSDDQEDKLREVFAA